MMVLTPDNLVGVKYDYYLQPDMMVSLLDYIDRQAPIRAHDFGRSIFRDYSSFRPLFMTNSYLNSFQMMPDANHLVVCYRSRGICRKYFLPEGKLFDGEYVEIPISSAEQSSTNQISNIIDSHFPVPISNEPVPQTQH